MTKRIKVAVSPFYGGTEWTDEFTGVTFKKNVNGLNVYSIPGDSDMTGIAAAIRLNALILFEGEINQDYIDASEGYKEPGRWTETVIQKTEPVTPEDPPAKEEEKEEEPVVEEPEPDPVEEPTEPVEGDGTETEEIQTFSLGETPAYETVNPDDMTVDKLKAHTDKYNIPVEGTGSGGNATKPDYIAAIKAYQE